MRNAIAVALAACLLQPAPAAGAEKPQVEQVVVVSKTHFDIGYTQLAREVVERYRTSMIDKALDVCDGSRSLPPENRFVWTLPGWPMAQILHPGQTPQRRTRVERAVREGLLVWHALAGTTHTESLGLEDLVRSLGFSSRLSREFDLPLPLDAKMTDVPCHSWTVPTVLKRAGVEFLHLGCNSASGSPDIPMLFWWEGPDGSRLLTMYTAAAYGTDLRPPPNWPLKTWLALIHTGDNHGPPTPQEVQAVLDRAKRELPGVKVRFGRLSDFGRAVLDENPPLPVVAKDMPDTWIHGLGSMPEEAALARRTRPQLAALESLAALLPIWGVKTDPAAAAVAAAYEGSYLYSEHTWGASSGYYSPRLYGAKWEEARAAGKYRYAEESWTEHGAYIRGARDRVEPALASQTAALAKAANAAGPRIVVYNPLPWPRDRLVRVGVPESAPAGWKDLATGEVAACERRGEALFLVASHVPGLGYRTYVPATEKPAVAPAAAPQDATVLENEFFAVRFDAAKGTIASLVDKRSGRELVDRNSEYGFGQYLYERFDKNFHVKFLNDYCKSHPGWVDEFGRANLPPASEVAYRVRSPQRFRLQRAPSAPGGLLIGAALTADDPEFPHKSSLSATLHRGRPYVDLVWRIENKAPDPWPEAGWLCLPFAVERPTFRLGRLGATIDPAKDVATAANFEMFAVDSGLTVTGGDGAGVGVCPLDTPLVSLGRPGAFRFSRAWTPRRPTVLVNLFNNVWGTNFQQWIGGTWSATVRIWTSQGDSLEKNLIEPAWDARTLFHAAYFDGPAGALPPAQAGLELSRGGVLATAFGPNPDGAGLVLRLWEQAGVDGPCRVRLPAGLKAAHVQPCDLRGRPQGQPIPVRDGAFDAPLTHYAPASFIIAMP